MTTSKLSGFLRKRALSYPARRLEEHREGLSFLGGLPHALQLAWTLLDSRVTSTLVGASTVAQLEENVGALDRLDFSGDELAEIDRYATESGINIWASSSEG